MFAQFRIFTRDAATVFGAAGLVICAGILLSGCSARHYRERADKEVYGILQQAHHQVFGTNSSFAAEIFTSPDPEKISPEQVIGDRNTSGTRTLTIDEAVNLAVQNSRRYSTEKERLYLTALSLSGERYAFSPHPFASVSGNFERQSNGEKFGTVRSQLGVTQLLKTGGSVGLRVANDLLRYYTGDPRRSVVSVISVDLVQPLFRGIGKYNPAVESLTQAERNVIYAVRDYNFFQQEYAITIVGDYFGLLQNKDVVRNRYTNYLSRVQATRRLEERFAGQRERAIDVDQARQAELSARNNYVNAVANYLNGLDQFKIELGLPVSEKLHLEDEALVQLQQHGLTPVQVATDFAYRVATQRQMQILNAIDQFEDSKRKIKVATNRLLPDLNLIADASLQSEEPTDYTNFDPDDIRAGVGVELDLPIDRLRERNNYRATLISFESELRNLALTLDNLKDAIERGLRTLEQRRETYEIQEGALQVANRRVLSATQLIEAGRAEVRDLVEAQDAQISAQNAVTQAIVSYQDAMLRLFLDIGILETESPRFWLKDHLAAFEGTQPAVAQDPAAPRPIVLPHEIF
ncbi:MAG TPA: TolC family protein [Verrucomicrobiae bacterium]